MTRSEVPDDYPLVVRRLPPSARKAVLAGRLERAKFAAVAARHADDCASPACSSWRWQPLSAASAPALATRHSAVVTARRVVTERAVRLRLAGQSLVGLTSLPAQDIEVILNDGLGPPVKRRYAIRTLRSAVGEIDVDVVLHENGGPGSRWAAQAEISARVEFVGPCGKLELLAAYWHLFVGDEAAVPATSALCEALRSSAASTAILQVASEADRTPIASDHVRWVTRNGVPADTVELLRSAVDGFALPSWEGRAYLLGEGHTVGVLRDLLEARGLERNRIFAKGYWRARSALQRERSA
ncbi:MAG: siderophore-interacting protein [Acidimicrobiales bacterium]